jgi:hypothetical protein
VKQSVYEATYNGEKRRLYLSPIYGLKWCVYEAMGLVLLFLIYVNNAISSYVPFKEVEVILLCIKILSVGPSVHRPNCLHQ